MQYLDLKCIGDLHYIMDNDHIDVKAAVIQADYIYYTPGKELYGEQTRGFPLYLYQIATKKEFDIDMAKAHLDYIRTAEDVEGKAGFIRARNEFRSIMSKYNVELTEEVELWMRLTW